MSSNITQLHLYIEVKWV